MKPVSKDGFLVPVCPHCLVDAVPRERHYATPAGAQSTRAWECPQEGCDARVGVHKLSARAAPLGTLARAPLRRLRAECHDLFDPLWRPGPHQVFAHRTLAYRWLGEAMGLPPGRCHFGEFDEAACARAIDAMFDLALKEFPCPH